MGQFLVLVMKTTTYALKTGDAASFFCFQRSTALETGVLLGKLKPRDGLFKQPLYYICHLFQSKSSYNVIVELWLALFEPQHSLPDDTAVRVLSELELFLLEPSLRHYHPALTC